MVLWHQGGKFHNLSLQRDIEEAGTMERVSDLAWLSLTMYDQEGEALRAQRCQ